MNEQNPYLPPATKSDEFDTGSIVPYPENVPGDFYVESGCCTLCEVPVIEASELFAYAMGADGLPDHCFVSRQPASDAELDNMVSAICCAELQCIRYRGDDSVLLDRLVQLGQSQICDAISRKSTNSRLKPWWHLG